MAGICAVFVFALLPFCADAELAGQVRVIDADTWDVDGERVRLFGIDAPETDQTCTDLQGQSWSCGVWSTDQAHQRFGGRRAECQRLDQDRYGRTVARCFVDGRDVAREMVADGLAFAYRRYSQDYVRDEADAVLAKRGIHAGLVQSPADFRAGKPSGS